MGSSRYFARAKSSRGDWIIEPSHKDGHFIHVAGIDSPGLAGSPAVALEVVRLLRSAGLDTLPNSSFNPNRAPIITPKRGMKGLKMGPVGKNDSNGLKAEEAKMASNVVCKVSESLKRASSLLILLCTCNLVREGNGARGCQSDA